MEDTDILQHLLEIEGQAATLVDDAQAEADRRIKEAEEQNRIAYDKAYQQLIAELDTDYQKTADAVQAEYNLILDEYRKSLNSMPMRKEEFSALAYSLLVEGK
jgi:vacuolar-type H+-ATPase subunit H